MLKKGELYTAVKSGKIDVVRHLLAVGHDPNEYEYDAEYDMYTGYLPLCIAASDGDMPMVTLLLEAGADMSRHGEYPYLPAISHAARTGELEIVRMLHERGASLYDDDIGNGPTLLQAACCGQLAVVQYLLAVGATQSDEDCDIDGESAIWWAEVRGHEAVAAVLRAHPTYQGD
jgi:ankyrin repeat protein